MRDRDFEDGILNPFKYGMEEEKQDRYLLLTGELDRTTGAEISYAALYNDLEEAAIDGERYWQKKDCDWFHVVDILSLNIHAQPELQRLTSDRNHLEAADRAKAYRGE